MAQPYCIVEVDAVQGDIISRVAGPYTLREATSKAKKLAKEALDNYNVDDGFEVVEHTMPMEPTEIPEMWGDCEYACSVEIAGDKQVSYVVKLLYKP